MWFTGALLPLILLCARGAQGLNLTSVVTMGYTLTLEDGAKNISSGFFGGFGQFTCCAMVGMLCATSICSLVKLDQLIYNFYSQRMSFLYFGLTSGAVFCTGALGLAEAAQMVGLVSLGHGLIICIAGRPVIHMLGLLAPALLTVGVSVLTDKWFTGQPVPAEDCELAAKVSLWLVLVSPLVKRVIGRLYTSSITIFLLTAAVLTVWLYTLAMSLFPGLPMYFPDFKVGAKVLSYLVFTFSISKHAVGKISTWRTTPFLDQLCALVLFTIAVSSPVSKVFFGLPECYHRTEFVANILPYMVFAIAVFKCTGGKHIRWNTVLLLLLGIPLVQAVCPHCSNHCTDCTFDQDGNCPALGEVVMNAAIIGGLTAGTGKILQIKNSILPRFMRAIGGAAMHFFSFASDPKEPTWNPICS